MKRRHWAVAGILALMLLCSAACRPTAEKKTPPDEKTVTDSIAGAGEEAVFDMKEVSLYSQKERAAISEFPIFSGQIASLRTEPPKEVRVYPKLNSKQPLYGSIVFDRSPGKPDRATRFCFVLDQSGTADGADERATKADAAKSAAGNRPKSRYDRLYFDADRDLDLTNDPVVSPMQGPPNGLVRLFDGPQAAVIFNPVTIPLDENPKATGQAVHVLPVIVLYGSLFDGNAGRMVFMAASARKGEIRLGTRAYSALLVPRSGMIDRMNHPNTQFVLTSVNEPQPVGSDPGTNILDAIRESDGECYRISATPSGDRLTVRPVGGERGLFELSVGDKQIKPLAVFASLALKESASKETILLLGEMGSPMQPDRAKTAEHRLPVGDYRPLRLTVDCGELRISLRPDYTLNSGGASKPSGTIEIRKDKPYVLDVATKPEVYFRAPSEGATFKPGDQIWLGAVLRIPRNGFMIDGLEGVDKKAGEITWTTEDGKQMTSPRYASFAPTVVITDSSGKKVAEGTMPFG
jgi:hypothetical protein